MRLLWCGMGCLLVMISWLLATSRGAGADRAGPHTPPHPTASDLTPTPDRTQLQAEKDCSPPDLPTYAQEERQFCQGNPTRDCVANQAGAFAKDVMERPDVVATCTLTHCKGCGCPQPKCSSATLTLLTRFLHWFQC